MVFKSGDYVEVRQNGLWYGQIDTVLGSSRYRVRVGGTGNLVTVEETNISCHPIFRRDHREINLKIDRQKSRNWCWIEVARAIASALNCTTPLTQKDIFLKVAKKYAKDDTLVEEFEKARSNEGVDTKFDKKGDVMDSLDAVGCVGKKYEVQNGQIENQDAFEFVKENVILQRPMIAHMEYTAETLTALGQKGPIRHALMITGTIETQTNKRIIWMDPDPQKTPLGTKNRTPVQEFATLQGKAVWVAVTVVQLK
jgi:hypothetical protein